MHPFEISTSNHDEVTRTRYYAPLTTKKTGQNSGTRLSQSVEQVTLVLGVMSLRPWLDGEITFLKMYKIYETMFFRYWTTNIARQWSIREEKQAM